MKRIFTAIIILTGVLSVHAARKATVVADSRTRTAMARTSIFDKKGHLVGQTDAHGRIPFLFDEVYPLTLRYMGYQQATIYNPGRDTVFMQESVYELPEVVVNPQGREVLHLTGYLREYSTLSSLSDTVTLFREKTVDFMVPTQRAGKYRGWLNPRPLAVKSYYRFSSAGLPDSVSNYYSRHFSWADLVGLVDEAFMPKKMLAGECAADTVKGRYGTASRWLLSEDEVKVELDVLADTLNYRWVPAIAAYIHSGAEFDRLNVRYNFDNTGSGRVGASDLERMSFNIESKGRGRNMFQVFKKDEPYYVNTYAELYITDREYISVKQAKELEKKPPKASEVGVKAPIMAAELQPAIRELVARVDGIDHDLRRRNLKADMRLAGIDDLFKTRRSVWQQFWDIISPPTYNMNISAFPNLR